VPKWERQGEKGERERCNGIWKVGGHKAQSMVGRSIMVPAQGCL